MFFPGFSFYSEPRYQQPRAPNYFRQQRPLYQAYDDTSDEDDYDNYRPFYSRQESRRNAPTQQQQSSQQFQQPKFQCTCDCGKSHDQLSTQSNQNLPTTALSSVNGRGASQKNVATSSFFSPMSEVAVGTTTNQKQQNKSAQEFQQQPAKFTAQPAAASAVQNESPITTDDISTDDDMGTIIEDLNFNYWEEVGVSPNKNNLDDLLIEEYFSPEIEAKAKQLETILKRPFRECLPLVQEHPNDSISSLIQIAIKKYTQAAAAKN